MKILVPPLKTQGIKTKLVPFIQESIGQPLEGRWIEPFCGSCVVALNVMPERALLADTNQHIITLYKTIQAGVITGGIVKDYLEQEGDLLARRGQEHYYDVRKRFNETGQPLDFLFLNRSCFNGVMRFNRSGKFNVPFCHKPQRFERPYVTKIVNQVKNFAQVIQNRDWEFRVADFRQTLERVEPRDIVYADPPYAGRHVDYFNDWNEANERELVDSLKQLVGHFLLSTWYSNKYRENLAIMANWPLAQFYLKTENHFYHVGSTENLRNAVTEALISNYVYPQPLSTTRL